MSFVGTLLMKYGSPSFYPLGAEPAELQAQEYELEDRPRLGEFTFSVSIRHLGDHRSITIYLPD